MLGSGTERRESWRVTPQQFWRSRKSLLRSLGGRSKGDRTNGALASPGGLTVRSRSKLYLSETMVGDEKHPGSTARMSEVNLSRLLSGRALRSGSCSEPGSPRSGGVGPMPETRSFGKDSVHRTKERNRHPQRTLARAQGAVAKRSSNSVLRPEHHRTTRR